MSHCKWQKISIRAHVKDWTGSVHNVHVFGSVHINNYPEENLYHSRCIFYDSALENYNFTVYAFKKHPLCPMPREHESFKFNLSTARIDAAHKIGILKGIFCWLKYFSMKISKDKSIILSILNYIGLCVWKTCWLSWLLIVICKKMDGRVSVFDADYWYCVPRSYAILYRIVQNVSSKDERCKRLRKLFEFKEFV